MLNIIPPNKESGIFPAHKAGVKEYIFVKSGKLRVELGHGAFSEELEAGDSLFLKQIQRIDLSI